MLTSISQFSEADVDIRNTKINQKLNEMDVDIRFTLF